MKRTFIIVAGVLAVSPLWGETQCNPHEVRVIDAEVHCVDNGGIDIGATDEDGLKVACMKDPKVKSRCGPDGALTRLRAYVEWLNKLKQFEDQCSARGGTFGYQDPTFKEPHNESYCLPAAPEVGSNMFEEPLCNYRSVCPAVAVLCEKSCG